ncbi:MAG: hypothetical protein ACYTDY_01565 [Planctomycetota bacterium]
MFDSKRERGLTAVELAISVLVLGLTAGVISMSFGTSFRMWRNSGTSRELDRRSNRGLDAVLDALAYASDDTVGPDALTDGGSPFISFRIGTGFTKGARTLGPVVRIEWQPDPEDPEDGVDNNGNGLVDEGMVVRRLKPGEADEHRTVLARGVSRFLEGEIDNAIDDNGNGLVDEKGLSFERQGGIVTVRLTTVGHCDDEVIHWSGEGSVALRH